MAQIFHHSMNTIARATIFGLVFVVAGLGWVGYAVQSSPYLTNQLLAKNQPVPFSHEHHYKGLGIDCRYCHTSVEDSAFAGIPPTETCMSCHSKVWTNAALLEPVRRSWRENRPITGPDGQVGWTRVHNLPGFVYFNHSIHVNKGVGCSTCHGRVQEMPLMYKQNSLLMEWCLECHRDPAKNLRPRDQIFNMDWDPGAHPEVDQKALAERYHVASPDHLVTCYVCHR